MIKFDIIHFYSNGSTPTLPGLSFIKNGKTNNNEEDREAQIAYIGESLLSITSQKKTKKIFNIEGSEDIYMITFMCSNVNELRDKFKKNNIKTTTPRHSTRRNILLMPCKTKFKYMYLKPFNKSNIVFCFREINTSTDLINYQKSMIPNSAERDIMGIKEINLSLNISQDEIEKLSKIFDNSYIDGNEFSSEIYQNQTLTITRSDKENASITFEVRGKAFKGKEISLSKNESNKKIVFNY